jgi:hypothetical protein
LSKTEALIRLSGRIRYRRNAARAFRLSSKLYNHTVRRISRQCSLPTEFPDDFHIGNVLGAGPGELPGKTKVPRFARNDMSLAGIFGNAFWRALVTARNSMVFRWDWTPLSVHAFCDSPDGRQKIEKRSFGGPCFEGTLRNCLLSESSPVAGTIENLTCSLET